MIRRKRRSKTTQRRSAFGALVKSSNFHSPADLSIECGGARRDRAPVAWSKGHLRPASADELAELRKRKAHPFLLVRVRRSQKMSPSSAE